MVAVALQTVREDVARTTENYELSHDTVRSEAKRFGERLDTAVRSAEESADILDRDRITLGLIALAGHERDTILARVRERHDFGTDGGTGPVQRGPADRERAPPGPQRIPGAKPDAASPTAGHSASPCGCNSRLGLSGSLARMTADRFELLLSQRLILRDLGAFIDGRIRRIHGRRVAELLHELLARRVEAVETALDGLRLQYPGYAEELERRFIRRTALRLEEREYAAMHDDGLIGAEVYTA